MKFLFVIDNLSTGGAQRQIINLAVGLTRRGYHAEIFCYTPGELLAEPLYEMNIPIHQHFKRSRFSTDVIISLRMLFDNCDFDLALSFLTTPNLYTILAGKVFGLNHVPVVVSERFCDLPGDNNLMERLPRHLYWLADHVVVNSHHQRLNFEKKLPRLRGCISTIYNGYDLKELIPTPFEINHHELKLLTIASISRYKNGLCLIDALNILRQQYNLRPTVTWIGQKVMTGDRRKYLNEMENRIQTYNLEPQWKWLGQRIDIVQQFHQHDVLVHPSYGEGLPNVVCEALACGRPVIVSNTLDHPRLVQDGQSGLLFNWQNPEDLALKIKTYSDLTFEQRKEMGEKGRQFAEQNLSMSRYVDEYEQLFLDILSR